MDRAKSGYIQGIISIIINLLLFVLKYWAGIASGSIAIIADAWHTLSDSFSSLIVIFGIKLGSQKADKKHPFGHGKWEQIAAIFIGFLLSVIAYDFLMESIVRFKAQESAHFGTLAIVVTVISILIKEALAQYAFYIGKKTQNTSIKADGWHHRSDALSSIVVLVGIFLKDFFWWIDSAMGVIISIMLFYAVYEILKESINKLLGEKPSANLMEKVTIIAQGIYDQELYLHHFHIHNYGTHKELTFHIKLDKQMDLDTSHTIATRIEAAIRSELNIESTIHVEPINFEH